MSHEINTNEVLAQPTAIIPSKEWTDPATRERFEGQFRVALANSGHEFGPEEARRLASVSALGEAVVAAMKRDYGDESGFQVVTSRNHDGQTGKMTSGHLIFGARDRATAERFQPMFLREMNFTLEGLESSIRLGEPAPQAPDQPTYQ